MDDLEAEEQIPEARPPWGRKESAGLPSSNANAAPAGFPDLISFNRDELLKIFNLYKRKVGDGEWRDYAIEFTPHKAVFFIYRRACEFALYRIEKNPRLARQQGAYSVITATGLVLRHGHDLAHVITALDSGLKVISG
jgi:hypothetical protein